MASRATHDTELPTHHPYAVREGTIDDLELYRDALYGALAWNPARTLPPRDHTLAHPDVRRYHHGWGRHGDIGVVATLDGASVGAAFCRLFTDDDHGHGYVDAETPELGIAVHDGHRGKGVGRMLLDVLAECARREGFAQLSLSVEKTNPARRLYERAGYTFASEDGEGVRMVKRL
jgi:GNAT superfamily N-acetyltransferase